MRTKFKNRIMAFMTVFSIVITLLGGLPVRAEAPEHLLPEKLESSLKADASDRDSFWLTFTSREKTPEGDITKAVLHRTKKGPGDVTVYVRKDSTLVAPEDAKEDKDGDVPPYKAYTFKAQAETEIQIKSPDALKDDFPELVVTEGKWYSVLEEDDKTPSESAEEKTETETETENKAETKEGDTEEKPDRMAGKPLQLPKMPRAENGMDEEITHIVKIHKVDKETQEAMANVTFTASGESDQIVSGETDANEIGRAHV